MRVCESNVRGAKGALDDCQHIIRGRPPLQAAGRRGCHRLYHAISHLKRIVLPVDAARGRSATRQQQARLRPYFSAAARSPGEIGEGFTHNLELRLLDEDGPGRGRSKLCEVRPLLVSQAAAAAFGVGALPRRGHLCNLPSTWPCALRLYATPRSIAASAALPARPSCRARWCADLRPL